MISLVGSQQQTCDLSLCCLLLFRASLVVSASYLAFFFYLFPISFPVPILALLQLQKPSYALFGTAEVGIAVGFGVFGTTVGFTVGFGVFGTTVGFTVGSGVFGTEVGF